MTTANSALRAVQEDDGMGVLQSADSGFADGVETEGVERSDM